jgi:NAD(P)-dependent dehydrogenase (short-subunit alcohol dehydrogenase family)
MADAAATLAGRVALVTGGASGISRAMAGAFAAAGASVWVADLDAAGAAATADRISVGGGKAMSLQIDVTQRCSVDDAFAEIMRGGGRLDILFSGAGILSREPVLEVSEATWDRVLAVNLKGTLFCNQAAAKIMAQQNYGRIINVASGLAEGNPRNADYAASKAGVIALTRSLAMAMRERKVDVTVNAIAPGQTDTPMWRQGKSARQIEDLLGSGTIGQPPDMGSVVVFLAGKDSWPITGRVLARG